MLLIVSLHSEKKKERERGSEGGDGPGVFHVTIENECIRLTKQAYAP